MRKTFDGWKGLDALGKEVGSYVGEGDSIKSDVLLERLWAGVSEYVRFYPRLAFRSTDEDRDSEFYLYIMERRATLFEKFDPDQGLFRSYLSLRLRSHYLNFLKRESRLGEKDRVVFTDREELFSGQETAGGEHCPEAEENTGSEFFPPYEEEPLKYLVLKLHYWDFFSEEDFVRLKEFTGKKYGTLLMEFDQLRSEVVGKKQRRVRMDERLNSLYQELLLGQEKLGEMRNGTADYQNQVGGLERLNRTREQLLKEYHRASEFATLKAISRILEVDEVKVANIIGYQRKVLEKKYYGRVGDGK